MNPVLVNGVDVFDRDIKYITIGGYCFKIWDRSANMYSKKVQLSYDFKFENLCLILTFEYYDSAMYKMKEDSCDLMISASDNKIGNYPIDEYFASKEMDFTNDNAKLVADAIREFVEVFYKDLDGIIDYNKRLKEEMRLGLFDFMEEIK